MTSRRPFATIAFALALALPLAAGPAVAQEGSVGGTVLRLELNGVSPVENGCRLTFVVGNELAGDLSKAIFEFALFNTSGLVERLLTLDFKELPKNRTRVRQFDLSELDCAGLTRILVNDARACTGDGVAPAACMRDLETTTTSKIEFGS